MNEKKSLREAMERARQSSLEYPDVRYFVMDKKGKHAVVHSVLWVCRERILEGWYIYCTFINGEMHR